MEHEDLKYELLIKRAYKTALSAKRNGGDARYMRNAIDTLNGKIIKGLPSMDEQFKLIQNSLLNAVDIFYNWEFTDREKFELKSLRLSIVNADNVWKLNQIIDSLLLITQRFF